MGTITRLNSGPGFKSTGKSRSLNIRWHLQDLFNCLPKFLEGYWLSVAFQCIFTRISFPIDVRILDNSYETGDSLTSRQLPVGPCPLVEQRSRGAFQVRESGHIGTICWRLEPTAKLLAAGELGKDTGAETLPGCIGVLRTSVSFPSWGTRVTILWIASEGMV